MVKKTVRVLACSAVCAVVLTTVGYALGFFSAGCATGNTVLQMGGVSLEMDDPTGSSIHAVEWSGMHTARSELEQECYQVSQNVAAEQGDRQYALNSGFAWWWDKYEDNLNNLLQEGSQLSPDGFLTVQYAFVNASNNPAYFRIEKPWIEASGKMAPPLQFAVLAWASLPQQGQNSWNYDCTKDFLLIDPEPKEDFLYLEQPLEPGQQYCVTFVGYILGMADESALQAQDYLFTIGSAELIQATNNAVYLDDDWRRASEGKVSFVPYAENNG